jgi:SAM-dependent methyltransferase
VQFTSCPVCDDERLRPAYTRGGFRLVRCANCGLLFVNPQAPESETNELYNRSYFDRRNIGAIAPDPEAVRAFRQLSGLQRLAEIHRWRRPPGRLLDVGCGEGFFLDVAQQQSWSCDGVELSEFAAASAVASGVGTIFQGTLRAASFDSSSFDVVTMFDVIEHFHDPVAELAEIRRILKPNGLLYLLTPDVESSAARLMGRYWFEIKPPEHLFYFTRSSITRLLRKAGFTGISTHSGGKVLTLDYIALVLSSSAPWLSNLLRLSTGWLPIYRRPISFRSGFVLAQAINPAGGDADAG